MVILAISLHMFTTDLLVAPFTFVKYLLWVFALHCQAMGVH